LLVVCSFQLTLFFELYRKAPKWLQSVLQIKGSYRLVKTYFMEQQPLDWFALLSISSKACFKYWWHWKCLLQISLEPLHLIFSYLHWWKLTTKIPFN
jgi:hypothetical protein